MEPIIDFETTEARTRAIAKRAPHPSKALLFELAADALSLYRAGRDDLREGLIDYLKASGLVVYLAPTFAENVSPEAFDILSEFGPKHVVIIWRTDAGRIGWKWFPSVFRSIGYYWLLPGDATVSEAFESDEKWHWTLSQRRNGNVWPD